MGRRRPYRKRVPVAQPPRPPEGATLEELQVWQREVFEPWDARRQARQDGRALTPRETGRDRRTAEARDVLAAPMPADERPVSERVREIRFEDILARHNR